MPIISSQIVSQTVQIDGRKSVTEQHRGHNFVTYEVNYIADADLDINAVLAARAIAIGEEIDRRELIAIEAAKFELPLSQIEFLKRFTKEERTAVYQAKRDDVEVEDVWNFVMAAKDGIHLGNPLTLYGLAVLEAKGLIAVGRAVIIGTLND